MIKVFFTVWSHKYYCLEQNIDLLVDALFQEESYFFPLEMSCIAADGDEEIVFEKDEELLKEKYLCDTLRHPVTSEFALENGPGSVLIQSENIQIKSRTRLRGILEIISGRSNVHPNLTRITHIQRVKGAEDYAAYVQDCIQFFNQLQASMGLLACDGDACIDDGNTLGGVPRFQRLTLLDKNYINLFGYDNLHALGEARVEDTESTSMAIYFPGEFAEPVTEQWITQISEALDQRKSLFRCHRADLSETTVDYLDLSELLLEKN